MRKSIVATASVAILSVAALGACDMNFGKKSDAQGGGDAAQTATGAGGAGSTETAGGKPDDEGAGGGTAGGETTGGGEGGKPGEEVGGGSGGQAPAPGQTGGPGGVRSVGDVPPEFAQLMVQYLDYYQQNFAQGFGSAGVQDMATGLRAGNEYRWNVGTLRGGQTYTFLGACDNDCSDVDLIIEDENGNNVGQDLLTDDYPVVTITPRRDGPFTARVLLVNCTVEPCFVGARVVQQGR